VSGDELLPCPLTDEMLEVDEGPSLPRLELLRSRGDIAVENARSAAALNSGHIELLAVVEAVVEVELTNESKVGDSPMPSSLS